MSDHYPYAHAVDVCAEFHEFVIGQIEQTGDCMKKPVSVMMIPTDEEQVRAQKRLLRGIRMSSLTFTTATKHNANTPCC
jgi:hypothetical protein